MPTIHPEQIQAYQDQTFRFHPNRRLATLEQAVEFINESGFLFFWPFKGIRFPSLWGAVAGDRIVPGEHDDPAHITWDWKDKLIGQRRCYYGRVLKHHNAFISLELLPCFYALSPNYGDPDNDYLIDYEQGKLTLEARSIYEALLNKGQLDTIELRREAHLTSPAGQSAFNRALDELQMTFRILPVGISEAGAWHYAFIYDLTSHHFPSLVEDAHHITETNARARIAACHIRALGATRSIDMARLFRWQPRDSERVLKALVESGLISDQVEITGSPDKWIVWRGFLNAVC